jgi:hypothetical protein
MESDSAADEKFELLFNQKKMDETFDMIDNLESVPPLPMKTQELRSTEQASVSLASPVLAPRINIHRSASAIDQFVTNIRRPQKSGKKTGENAI